MRTVEQTEDLTNHSRADVLAAAILREAGFEPEQTVYARQLAEALMGPGCLRILDIPEARAHYARHGGKERIYLASELTQEDRRFLIFHEVAERHISRLEGYFGHDGGKVEALCDEIAGALVAARGPLLEQHGRGRSVSELARRFAATEEVIAERLDVVLGARPWWPRNLKAALDLMVLRPETYRRGIAEVASRFAGDRPEAEWMVDLSKWDRANLPPMGGATRKGLHRGLRVIEGGAA